MIIGSVSFPEKCPKDCRLKEDLSLYGQNSLCIRCPIFNCSKGEEGFSLLEPEEYREDWAKAWAEFFKGDLELPDLLL